MGSVKSGDVLSCDKYTTALDIHPDEFAKQVIQAGRNKEVVGKILDSARTLTFDRPTIGLVISTEPGRSFEYMKCDFSKQKYVFIDVTHYQILIEEKVYWQSFKSEDDFFAVWDRFE